MLARLSSPAGNRALGEGSATSWLCGPRPLPLSTAHGSAPVTTASETLRAQCPLHAGSEAGAGMWPAGHCHHVTGIVCRVSPRGRHCPGPGPVRGTSHQSTSSR